MAQPEGRVVIDEAEAQQAAKRYAQMEAELQALQQRNAELIRDLQEQQNSAAMERVRADRQSRAQTQEFANLTAELLAGRQGPQVQLDGTRLSVLRSRNQRITKATRPKTLTLGCFKCASTWNYRVYLLAPMSHMLHPCYAAT